VGLWGAELKRWAGAGFHFNLDCLLRSVNTVLTGEAKFLHLHDKTAEDVQAALKSATKHIDAPTNGAPCSTWRGRRACRKS
jgi:hypothetical protein